MNIDVDNIVKKMDVEKLIKEHIMSNITECVDVGDIVDDVLEDEKLKATINQRVVDVIEVYLLSDEGRECIIEKFKEFIVDSDMFVDDRITNVLIEFLRTSLVTRR